ncbi:MAG: AraC family transcriptional regulator [Burkholderiaceae bacterium]|nr:AraC family transcriptional regulator [Burkholderiaceae bacterium]
MVDIAQLPPRDEQRLNDLAYGPWQDTLTLMPEQVLLSSHDRNWPGLLVWHQRGESRELYVPPVFGHAVLVKLGRPTQARLLRARGASPQSPATLERFEGYWPVGAVSIVPAGEASYWRNEDGSDNLHIHIEPELLVRHAAAVAPGLAGSLAVSSRFIVQDERLRLLALTLMEVLLHPGPDDPRFVESMGRALAAHLLAHHTRFSQESSRVPRLAAVQLQMVLNCIDSDLAGRHSVEQLAALVGMSPWHFARCFKRSTGKSPHVHVNDRRMARAVELLAGTRQSVIDIALELGFSDPAHFSRNFRRHYGLTPQGYRKAC